MLLPDGAEGWTDAEIDWLDDLLMREDVGLDNPLFATEIDGFLCALLSGPELLMPSEALRWIFDGEAGEQQPQFADQEESNRFIELVMKQWNYIAASLMDGSYEPLLMLNRREDGSEVTQFSDWCVGYMTGVARDREGWSAMPVDDRRALLGTMLLYGTPDGWDALERQPPLSDDEHEALADGLGVLACEIHRYWLDRRATPPVPLRRNGAKLGRNDPCHCGSGRKYKHCHGTN
ncbi:MAG: UPF0149 family protein [Roseateles sp.]